MSKNVTSGKSLSGYTPLQGSLLDNLPDSVTDSITSGGVTFNNINITSGSINGVTLGNIQSGSITTTSIQSGGPGEGYSVCFYGTVINDSACWIPTIGEWDIKGSLSVRDYSQLGNLKIEGNILSSTNVNGSIYISPLGTGSLILDSEINHYTLNGDLLFHTSNGILDAFVSDTSTITSGKTNILNTINGDIVLETGSSIPTLLITFITTGTTNISITTSISHELSVDDYITVTDSNSIPSINGKHKVTSITSLTTFVVSVVIPVTSSGTFGHVSRQNNIFLTASNDIIIPQDINLTLGPSKIYHNSSSGNLTIDGNLVVNGDTTYIQSTVTSITDPVINTGGTQVLLVSDGMDRGISGRYYNGSSKKLFFGQNASSGCFTYIPDATETSPNVFTGVPGCAVFGSISSTSINTTNLSSTTSTFPFITTCNIVCSSNLSISAGTSTTISSPITTITGTTNTTNINSTGTANFNDANFTGTVTGINVSLTTENLYVTFPGVINPSPDINNTFINTTGSSSGTLNTSSTLQDGSPKHIILVSGGPYSLSCPSGALLDPGSGTTLAKTIVFTNPGQGIALLWNMTLNLWVVINGGGCIS